VDPTPKPPTRLVVSGGPKAEPRLYMAHRKRSTVLLDFLRVWLLPILIVAILIVLFVGYPR